MVTTGDTVSHYRILEKLGGGGMGVVYRAHDERLDRDVALKVLPTGMLADETARSRFRREALTLSQLNHPNVAVVYDYDSENAVDFLAMEYVAGETLAAKVAAGPLPEKEVIALGTQIAEALHEAHEHEIIHRDLKPGNVMVTAKGRVKVLDFGLAKLLKTAEDGAATASLAETQAGAIMGTLPYMAPEQLQGKAVDARADVYALGAVLYEMAMGRTPFPEKQASQLIAAILTQIPQAPRVLSRQVSPGLEAIIQKALQKDREQRYQSAKEVLEDFVRVSGPGSVLGAQLAAKARRWALAVVAAAGLISVVAVLVGLNVEGLWKRLRGSGGAAANPFPGRAAARELVGR
jgi:eukaryotic-like serine/threonine-protein kinase